MTSRTSSVRERPRWLSGSSGFTLLELLLAIGILCLATGLGLPRVDAVRDAYVRAEDTRAIEGILRDARHAAIENRSTVTITVSVEDPHVLEQWRDTGLSWPGAATRPHTPDYFEVIDPVLARSVRVVDRLEVRTPPATIEFHSDGTSSGGELVVREDDGTELRRFRVDAATGAVVTRRDRSRDR